MNHNIRKDVFGIDANNKETDQLAEIYSLIRKFAILRYIL